MSIQRQVSSILDILQIIQTDVSTLKTDVSTLKTDVSTLKTDVSTLKTDVASLVDWRRKLSTISEENTNSFFENEFRKAFPSSHILRSYIRDFYEKNSNKLLTDIDGCFLINPKIEVPKKNLSKQQKAAKALAGPFRNNSSTKETELSYTVFIENKLTLDKRHVDQKVMLYQSLLDSLREAKTNSSIMQDSLFKTMVDVFDFKTFPDKLMLIFASENISESLKNYISAISNGDLDTEEKYKLMTFGVLLNDKTYIEFNNACLRYSSTNKPRQTLQIKTFFEDIKKNRINSFDYLKKIIDFIETNTITPSSGTHPDFDALVSVWNRSIPYLRKCMTDFTTLSPELTKLKNLAGYINNNQVVCPLFVNSV